MQSTRPSRSEVAPLNQPSGESSETRDDEIDLRDLLARLWRGRLAIAIATVLCGAAGAGWVYSREPTSTTHLILEVGSRPAALALGVTPSVDATVPLEAPASLLARIRAVHEPAARQQVSELAGMKPAIEIEAIEDTSIVDLSTSCPAEFAGACRRLLERVADSIAADHAEILEQSRADGDENLEAERRYLQALRDALAAQKEVVNRLPLSLSATTVPVAEEPDTSDRLLSRLVATDLVLETTSRLPRTIVIREHGILRLERLLGSLRNTRVLSIQEDLRSPSHVPLGAGVVGGFVLGCFIALFRTERRIGRSTVTGPQRGPNT